eukprot:4634750-Prymnesium_polylepis.1
MSLATLPVVAQLAMRQRLRSALAARRRWRWSVTLGYAVLSSVASPSSTTLLAAGAAPLAAGAAPLVSGLAAGTLSLLEL